jgi:hypothetical protein
MDDGLLLGYNNSKEDPHFMNHTLVPITYTTANYPQYLKYR